MQQVIRVINWFNEHKHLDFEIHEDLVGGISYDEHGQPLTDKTLEKAKNCDAVLLGAVGGPKYDNLRFFSKARTRFIETT